MMLFVLVAIGGAIGSVGRMLISEAMVAQFGKTFPWGTLVVNVAGSFLIGFLAVLAAAYPPSLERAEWRAGLIIGLCGGFTTFSTFSLQTLKLLEDGHWGLALGNVLGSVGLCLLGVWLGMLAAKWVNGLA